MELDTSIRILFAISTGKCSSIEVIPFVINRNPTAGQITIDHIVVLTFKIQQSRTGECISTITSNLSFGCIHFKCMTECDVCNFTPFNRRVTFIAECASHITGLAAGSFNRINFNGSMYMGGTMVTEVFLIHVRHNGIHFRIHMEFFIGECAHSAIGMGDETHIHIHLHILCPEGIRSPVGFSSISGGLNIRIKIQNTNRKLRQDDCTGLGIVSSACDRNSRGVGFFSNSVGCRETFRQSHMIQLPMVYIVQVDYSFYRLNGFDLRCFKVHPVNRTERNSVKCRIGRNYIDRRFFRTGFHFDHTDNNGLIACIIADFKLHAMVTVSHFCVSRDHTVRESRFHFDTVNIYLGGIGI